MTTGTMDMSAMMDINNLMETMNEAEKEPQKKTATILSCYGCEHMCASPLVCDHPSGMAVRWDPVRDKSYRIPSMTICVENGGVCKFFEPDAIKGAGGYLKKKQKATVTKIDSVLDQLDDDSVPIEDFLNNLKDLDDELTKEERGEPKDEGKDTNK
jgi:hypothetical protein